MLIDLPGTYSLYPKSMDERVPFQVLCDPQNEAHPDLTIIIADGTNLKRSLFLCSQIVDLKRPAILVINMMDIVRFKGIEIDFEKLSERLGIPVVAMNARKQEGVEELKRVIPIEIQSPPKDFFRIHDLAPEVIDGISKTLDITSDYNAFQIANNIELISQFNIKIEKRQKIKEIIEQHHFDAKNMQAKETLERYKVIVELMKDCVHRKDDVPERSFTNKIDRVLTHRVFGYLIFLVVLFLIFQAIFAWASYPMELVDNSFKWLSGKVAAGLPKGVINDLLVNGILAGINGIVIFVPQITLLFLFILILEDTGYMARVSFLMDKLLRGFGLNGKSVIPLMSGVACAVPAIMSTRTIQSWKQRIITIMVTPLMSCSARLPVYTLLIGLIIPARYIWGVNMQGLVLMMMYLIGFVAAIGSAWLMKYFIKATQRDYFIMEMPMYKVPRWKTIGLLIIEKVKVFLFDAGKVIIAISVILWFLSSFAPGKAFENIENKYHQPQYSSMSPDDVDKKIQSAKLSSSYAGKMGRLLEPVIKPLGFDWKIGIALITSFAAREVFVGTMATIYSVGSSKAGKLNVKEKMRAEMDEETGKAAIYFCSRTLPYAVLRFCHAVYEHTCSGKKRNTKLEMAAHPISIYERAGLLCKPYCLPVIEVTNVSYLFRPSMMKV